jgi:hypothetical protein
MTTTALDAADAARLDAVRDQWIAIGNSTEPVDRATAEAGVAEAYQAAGLNPPKYVFWVDSPWAAILATAVLPEALTAGDASGPVKVAGSNHLAKLRALVAHNPAVDTAAGFQQTITSLLDPVENAISATLNGATDRRSQEQPDLGELRSVVETVRATLARQLSFYAEAGPFNANVTPVSDRITRPNTTVGQGVVPRDVDNYVMENVTNSVLAANLREPEHRRTEDEMNAVVQRLNRSDTALRAKIERWARGRIWAQYNSGYYGYIAGLQALGFDINPIEGQLKVAANSGWWWAFHDFTILTERATTVALDPQGRLHRADGPAIEYPDGWGVYMWHGHRIPGWVVQSPNHEKIIAERNVEVRRCAIESYGWDRFIRDAGLRLLDSCDDPGNPGHELELYDVPESLWGARVRVLLCINGSPRADGEYPRFGLRVPANRNINTALEAAAWGYGLEAEQYATLQRRA